MLKKNSKSKNKGGENMVSSLKDQVFARLSASMKSVDLIESASEKKIIGMSSKVKVKSTFAERKDKKLKRRATKIKLEPKQQAGSKKIEQATMKPSSQKIALQKILNPELIHTQLSIEQHSNLYSHQSPAQRHKFSIVSQFGLSFAQRLKYHDHGEEEKQSLRKQANSYKNQCALLEGQLRKTYEIIKELRNQMRAMNKCQADRKGWQQEKQKQIDQNYYQAPSILVQNPKQEADSVANRIRQCNFKESDEKAQLQMESSPERKRDLQSKQVQSPIIADHVIAQQPIKIESAFIQSSPTSENGSVKIIQLGSRSFCKKNCDSVCRCLTEMFRVVS